MILETPERPLVREERTVWYLCPHCGKKLFAISEKAVVRDLSIRCHRCKEIVNVNLQ